MTIASHDVYAPLTLALCIRCIEPELLILRDIPAGGPLPSEVGRLSNLGEFPVPSFGP